MADSSFQWSDETFRLDELGRKVDLPKIIQLMEGIDTGNDVDSFSAEDIITIDQCVTLQKVAAQFAEKLAHVNQQDSGHAILNEEILIPLNYNGKLRVINPIRTYYRVQDLAREFPRYATVLEPLPVSMENGPALNIAPGTSLELNRVIPGRRNECDRLVINTAMGGREQMTIPLDMNLKFRSCPDENVYTLKEVIDRYVHKWKLNHDFEKMPYRR